MEASDEGQPAHRESVTLKVDMETFHNTAGMRVTLLLPKSQQRSKVYSKINAG